MQFISDCPGFQWILSFRKKDVPPSWQHSMVGTWSQQVHKQLQPPHLQDLGDSSKSLILVTRNDKEADAEEDRKLGNKQKKKRQQEKKLCSRMVARRRNLIRSGRADQHFSGSLPNYINHTQRFQFPSYISEFILATHVVGRDQS